MKTWIYATPAVKGLRNWKSRTSIMYQILQLQSQGIMLSWTCSISNKPRRVKQQYMTTYYLNSCHWLPSNIVVYLCGSVGLKWKTYATIYKNNCGECSWVLWWRGKCNFTTWVFSGMVSDGKIYYPKPFQEILKSFNMSDCDCERYTIIHLHHIRKIKRFFQIHVKDNY